MILDQYLNALTRMETRDLQAYITLMVEQGRDQFSNMFILAERELEGRLLDQYHNEQESLYIPEEELYPDAINETWDYV